MRLWGGTPVVQAQTCWQKAFRIKRHIILQRRKLLCFSQCVFFLIPFVKETGGRAILLSFVKRKGEWHALCFNPLRFEPRMVRSPQRSWSWASRSSGAVWKNLSGAVRLPTVVKEKGLKSQRVWRLEIKCCIKGIKEKGVLSQHMFKHPLNLTEGFVLCSYHFGLLWVLTFPKDWEPQRLRCNTCMTRVTSGALRGALTSMCLGRVRRRRRRFGG